MHDGDYYQRAPLPYSGDEACDFCEAIVGHWRDVLTANTTEVEFKQVRTEKKRKDWRGSKRNKKWTVDFKFCLAKWISFKPWQ